MCWGLCCGLGEDFGGVEVLVCLLSCLIDGVVLCGVYISGWCLCCWVVCVVVCVF